ncbi:MAG TPA: DUF485 domain-containing protein [Thermoanaerobaculia bacterium]|nr:DUF485 domain-containing protein [Thermoanaerobaculia bacterium]
MRQLRRRRVSDAQRLDIPQSIAATIEAGGFPCLCSKPDSELPEYLALIERASFRDHQALLFDRLAKTLEAEGLFLVSYFYDRDPRVCQPRDGSSTVRLNDLRKRHPEHRLLLFTAGEELIDPISGGLASSMSLLLDWRERVVLTPKERGAWGFRERTLEEAFVVLPATVLGLSQLADRLELPTRLDQAEPAREASGLAWSGASRAASVDDLRRYLGEPGFEWLCACAVYPELHWDMTLYLGALPALGKGCLREESLLRLACLPWFRGGTLPDNLRLRLLEQLSPAQEREARNAVVKLLRDNPARPGSFAASARELQILAQDVYLARNEPERLRRFLRRLKDFPQGDAAADGVFLRFLETAQLSRLAIHVPATVRTILFERGVPAFGPKRVTSVLRALPLALTAAWEIVRDLMARKGGKQTADRDAGAWEERYQGLVARRWSIALVLMLALFLLYYGYIVLIALNKPFLARKLGAVTPLGILLGVAVIVFSWLLAAVYFSWVNKTYYPEAGKLKDELTGKGIGPGRTALGPRGLSGRPEEVASPVALANGRPKPESAVSGQRVATSVAQASWRTEAKIVFSYLGVLAFVVLLIEKKDEEVKWHARNGSALLVCEIGLWVAQLVGRILHEPLSSSLACIQGLLTSALWLGILVMHFRCMAAGLRGRRLRIRGISGLADRFSVPHSESSGPAVDVVTWPGGPGVTALLVVGLAISTSLILAPISWYLAERELRAIRQGRSPAPGERIARASRIVGILGTLIFVINLFLFIWSSFMS